MSEISDADMIHIFRCVQEKFVTEVRSFKHMKETTIDEDDTPILYAITNLASNLLIYNKTRVHVFKEHVTPILLLLVQLVSNKKVETGNSYVTLTIETFKHFSSALQSSLFSHPAISEHDVQLINRFILGRFYPRTLHADFLGLMCNYLTYGSHMLEADMRDRLLHECVILIDYNIKSFTKSRGVLQLAYANILAQTVVSSCHEYLAKSQVEDFARRALDVMQQDIKADIVQGSALSTLHTLLFYCPKITLEVLRRREALTEYLVKLNKDLRKVSITASDRSLVILGLISFLQNTLGTEEENTIDTQNIFRFVLGFAEYHTYLSRDNQQVIDKTYSLREQTRIGNLEKNLKALKLVKPTKDEEVMLEDASEGDEENPYVSRAYDYYNKISGKQNRKGSHADGDSCSNDDDYSDDGSSLAASEESFEMEGGCFNENSYKKFIADWANPFSRLDEFEVFNQFVALLRRSYDSQFIALTRTLSQEDKRTLRDSLYTKKVQISAPKILTKPKVDFRKVYKVKRIVNMSFMTSEGRSTPVASPVDPSISSVMETEI